MLVYEKRAIYLNNEPSRIEKSRHFVYVRALINERVQLRIRNAKLKGSP